MQLIPGCRVRHLCSTGSISRVLWIRQRIYVSLMYSTFMSKAIQQSDQQSDWMSGSQLGTGGRPIRGAPNTRTELRLPSVGALCWLCGVSREIALCGHNQDRDRQAGGAK